MSHLFMTTDWSTVHKAWLDTPEGSAGLEDVCIRYRKPAVLYLDARSITMITR